MAAHVCCPQLRVWHRLGSAQHSMQKHAQRAQRALTRGSMRKILPPSAGITSSRPLLLLAPPLPLPRRVNTPSAYLGQRQHREGVRKG